MEREGMATVRGGASERVGVAAGGALHKGNKVIKGL